MATFGLSLGVPSTDHDTDMLSDAGRSDVDFDIDVDVPLAIGDQDDFMADTFDADVDANDAEMLEEYDDQRVNEAEMFDDDLDEDDQMDNIDFDQPAQTADSDLAFFVANTEAPIQEHHIDFADWPSDSHINQPNATDENTGDVPEIPTTEANPSKAQSLSEVTNTNSEEHPVQTTAEDTTTPSQKPTENVTQVSPNNNVTHASPPQEDLEAIIAHSENPGTRNEDNTADAKVESELPDDPEEDLITYDEETGAESPLAAQETTTGQPSTAEIPETSSNIQLHDSNSDEEEAPHQEVHIERNGLTQGETISDSAKEKKDEVHEEQPTEEQVTENHETEDPQDYSYDVIVQYGGTELSLFPPSRHDLPETYLLQDHSIAEKSLAELFAACREVLGSSISERDALEMEIPAFELYIHEDSSECPSISISQVVDVYFRLHENDGVEEPHPLTVLLKTRLRFGARLTSLFETADTAKGFSALKGHREENHSKDNIADEEDHDNNQYGDDGHQAFSSVLENQDNWNTEEAEADVKQDGTFAEVEIISALDTEEQQTEPSHSSEIILNNESGIQHADITHVESGELASVDRDEDDGNVENEPEEGDLIDYLDDKEDLEDSGRSSTIEGDIAQTESETVTDNSASNAVATNSASQNETGASEGVHISEEASTTNEESLQQQTQSDIPATHDTSEEKSEEPNQPAPIEVTELGDKDDDPHSIDDLYLAQEGLEDEYDGSDAWHEEEKAVIYSEALDESHKNTVKDSTHHVHESCGEAEHDDFEINIGWDEEEEIHEPNTKPESPLGKRNFDEHAEGAADIEFDQEVKRIKST